MNYKGGIIGSEKRNHSYLAKKQAPGPGSYLIMDGFFRENHSQGKKPAAFGSSDKRCHI